MISVDINAKGGGCWHDVVIDVNNWEVAMDRDAEMISAT